MRRWLALASILSLVLASTAAAQWKPEVKFLKIGVSSAGGDWFRAGAKFATLLPEALPGVATTTLIGGAVVNVSRLGKGEVQLGFTFAPYPEEGYHGRGAYKEAFTNIRLVASNLGRVSVIACFVLKDSPIRTLQDLKGKRIVAGDRGWGTTALAEAVMTAAGMAPDTFRAQGGTISYTSITDRSKALQDRNVDAIFIPAQVPYPDLMVVQQAVGLRAIPFPADVVDRAIGLIPGAIKARVPRGLYGVVDAELPSPGFYQQLVADAGLSDELVYRLTKFWWARVKELGEVAPSIDQADPKIAMEGATIPFHPGALRYYKEIGVAR
jgi:hypothetical protein